MKIVPDLQLAFDHHAINHATVAIREAMSPACPTSRADTDTLFMGGPALTDAERQRLARFALDKNYKIVFAVFGDDVGAGPTDIHAVVTDGTEQAIGIPGGRLWMQDQRSPVVLVLADVGALVGFDAAGRMQIREMCGSYHEDGYELARSAVIRRAASKPGRAPVIGPVGSLITVMDMLAFSDTFAAAA